MFLVKEVVFGLKWLYSGKAVVIEINCFFSGKSGCIRENGLYSVKWLNSGSGCIRAKMVVFGKSGFTRAK